MSEQIFYGWFDDPAQAATYDPPHDAPCPYCGCEIVPDDVRTHSVMAPGDYAARSYFYRSHRSCDDASEQSMDDFIWQMIERNGD